MRGRQVNDPCPYCGHSTADDHDEFGFCHGETYLGGDPPVHKSCSCNPYNALARSLPDES